MVNNKININKIKADAEKHYAEGDYYCSEAIVAAFKTNVDVDIPQEAIAMASGFPVGIGGAKCVCGAVSGGVMCLGYFFGRVKPKDSKVGKVMALANELLESFTTNHRVTCCKILTKGMELGSPSHIQQCVNFTGEVAKKTAEIVARELGLEIVE